MVFMNRWSSFHANCNARPDWVEHLNKIFEIIYQKSVWTISVFMCRPHFLIRHQKRSQSTWISIENRFVATKSFQYGNHVCRITNRNVLQIIYKEYGEWDLHCIEQLHHWQQIPSYFPSSVLPNVSIDLSLLKLNISLTYSFVEN